MSALARNGAVTRTAWPVVASVALLVGLVGCGSAKLATPQADTMFRAPAATHALARAHWSKQRLLHPTRKYYGVSTVGARASLQQIPTVKKETHKTPNLVMYYQDWTRDFDVASGQAACRAGILPMMTWESESWQVGTAIQPAYALRRIIRGRYDAYIRRIAREIASLHCPLVLRLDHEPNGTWYPWAIGTPRMHNTAAQYVAMWRHVWKIFHRQHVHNVIWNWSPNFLLTPNNYNLATLYPGNRYVDLVGIDGYLLGAKNTPSSVFDLTLHALRTVAPHKPWFVAETGVGPSKRKPRLLRQLLAFIANNPRLIGLVYLNQKARADWRFDATAQDLRSFRAGIDRRVYASARRGSL